MGIRTMERSSAELEIMSPKKQIFWKIFKIHIFLFFIIPVFIYLYYGIDSIERSILFLYSSFFYASTILFPTFIVSLLLFVRLKMIKRIIFSIIVFGASLYIALFFICESGACESPGIYLYFPAAFITLILFTCICKIPNKILNYTFLTPFVVFLLIFFFVAQRESAIKEEGSTLSEVYSKLRRLSSFNEMNAYCDSIKIASQKTICINEMIYQVLDQFKDKTTPTLTIIEACRKIEEKGEQKRNCLATIHAYRLSEIQNNAELADVIEKEIQATYE